jgi:hypothetical protein
VASKKLVSIVIFIAVFIVILTGNPQAANGFSFWILDTSTSNLVNNAQIGKYIANLKAHGIEALLIRFGASEYQRNRQIASEAKKQGLKVIAVLPTDVGLAWDKNPSWRKKDHNGKDILVSGSQKTFCPNSPYWEKVFFPTIRKIASESEIDGFYFDTSFVAYGSGDTCFCTNCRSRFEKETGKKLPPKPISPSTWNDPTILEYVSKRTEWLNALLEHYVQEVNNVKPGALALLSTDYRHDNYKNGISGRYVKKLSTILTPFILETPSRYVVNQKTNLSKNKASKKISASAESELIHLMNRYGYYEFLLKLAAAGSNEKLLIPFVPTTVLSSGIQDNDLLDLEIAQIELAISAGAKGYCFDGQLAASLSAGKTTTSTWENQKLLMYLKQLTIGERGKWIADMHPDSRVAILCNQNALFWEADNSRLLKTVGGMYALLQYGRKIPVSFILPSEPGNKEGAYKLDPNTLSKFDIVIAIGLDYLSREDLQSLRSYLDKGGNLLILGPINRSNTRDPAKDDAFEILGITTEGPPTPSGFLLPAAKHPVFTVPGGFSGPMGSFRLSADKYAAYSYKPKFGDGWDVLAYEVNDEGKRPAIVAKETSVFNIAYVNSDAVSEFDKEMQTVLVNLVIVASRKSTSVFPLKLSATATVNTFKGSDGLTRYINIFTPSGEGETQYRIRTDPNAFPIGGQVILSDGSSREIKITQENREPNEWEMTIGKTGNGILKLGPIKPPFATVKLRYERRENQQ